MSYSRQAISTKPSRLSELVEKHDKTLHICVDYRCLNAQAIKDVYPTPRVEDAINDMKGARYFRMTIILRLTQIGIWMIWLRHGREQPLKSIF